MAKFCTKCGKPLVDGKPCSCQTKEIEKEEEKVNIQELEEDEVVVKPERGEKPKKTSSNYEIMDIVKGMFKKPYDTLEDTCKVKYFNLAIGVIIACSIVFGIFMYSLISNQVKKLGTTIAVVQNTLNTSLAPLSILGINLKLDVQGTCTKLAVIMAVMSGLIILITYLMNKYVFKKELDIKKITTMVGMSEVMLTVGMLVCIVLSFISSTLAVLAFIYFAIVFFVHLYQGCDIIKNSDPNKALYTYIASSSIPAIFIVVICTIQLTLSIVLLSAGSYITNSKNPATNNTNSGIYTNGSNGSSGINIFK